MPTSEHDNARTQREAADRALAELHDAATAYTAARRETFTVLTHEAATRDAIARAQADLDRASRKLQERAVAFAACGTGDAADRTFLADVESELARPERWRGKIQRDQEPARDVLEPVQHSANWFSISKATCRDCGHQHAGPEVGGICIGCPCERRAS